MMKQSLIIFAALAATACSSAPQVTQNNLRLPAYPLVTIDPYTSGWSMSDQLYEGSVKHWTSRDFPLIGALKVDGEVYRFMGIEDVEMRIVAPTSQQESWEGRYTTSRPSGNWTAPDYDDHGWQSGPAAFGTRDSEPTAKTSWTTENIWVRRTVTLDEDLTDREIFLEFSNDDDAVFYVNGIRVYSTGATCNKNAIVKLPAEAVATLRKGENLLAAECRNPWVNGLLDFGLQTPRERTSALQQTAQQLSVNVQATQTHYTFRCGGVDLALSFAAPLFADDLELLSRPVNYISYDITSNDGRKHDIELYLEASPRWALDQPYQKAESERFERDGMVYLKSGSVEQQILAKRGDDLRIDWGYFYLAADKKHTQGYVGDAPSLRKAFVEGDWSTTQPGTQMALVRSLGTTDAERGHVMIAYDDLYSIQYFGDNLRPYWNRDGQRTIFDQIEAADREYDRLIARCYEFDARLMAEAEVAGGRRYAELCAAAYRQIITAHKLVEAPNGDLLWLSKENNSNGSIGTVDITYPSSPFFLLYNTELAKGLMNHIYHYSESGRWKKPFPAHDVGTYPLANGQTYGGDMPIEEAGNMIILTAAVSIMEQNTDYAARHWEMLTLWTDYLVEHGLDPANQLCTDDFAGHFAHNANLSIKAILAIASYGRMAEMQGQQQIADHYTAKAREMAAEWIRMADDGDHYRLTFDKAGTWSQKYNLVWDRLLKLDIFPASVAEREIAYYLTLQNRYGLPLDNRETYTKSDWIMWTATMADDRATFERFISPLYDFYNETVDRVPMSDWIFTDRPNFRGFRARSVVGGYYIKMLEPKILAK